MEDIVAMARAAEKDERLSDGALYGKLADRIELLTSSIIAAERERCAKLVPTTWLDELLTGKDAPKLPLDARAVEALLRGIQDRIRADGP